MSREIVLWESPDDKGNYIARTIRTGDRTAELQLLQCRVGRSTGTILKRESVSLAFGARFGPDVDDVRTWNKMATAWSDEMDAIDNPPT